MKQPLGFFLITMLLSGCSSLDRMLGTEKKKEERKTGFYVVACCQDNDGHDNLTWPSFLPQAHIDLCVKVHTACYNNDCQINGDLWLDTHVDCGTFGYKIGDEYYKGKGY